MGDKGGFEVEVQLLPLTAVQGVDYQLDYSNRTGRVVFARTWKTWLVIDIFEGSILGSREFLVKIVGSHRRKPISNAAVTVQMKILVWRVDQRSKVGWEKCSRDIGERRKALIWC